MLRRLNDAVLRDDSDGAGRYLTGIFATASVDAGQLKLDLAVGGHPPPLVLRADGTVERVPATGPLIGVTAEVRYLPAAVRLDPGDTLVLYTDGLTDARAPRRILTDHGLAELLVSGLGLDPEDLAELLERHATQGEKPRDDIALLVIRAEA